MTQDETLQLVAKRLRTATADGEAIAPVRDELVDGGIDGAYAVQEINTRLAMATGRRLVGRKVGLTAEVVQRQLGVDQPDFGALFADMSLFDGEGFSHVLQPRVEAEVAVVLARDLPHPDSSVSDLLGAIDYLLPVIEVVGSRIAGWDIGILDTIADNASCGAFVLGTRPVRPQDIELRSIGMILEVDGAVASVGSGAACLGHPYRSALWLARRMVAVGTPLRAGDVVLTGALGPMVDLPAGSAATATLQGLGTVRTRHLRQDEEAS